MRFTPELRDELRDVLKDDRLSRHELAEALSAYQGLAPYLLRAAQRPGYTPESLEQVLARYGTRRVAQSLERLWRLIEQREALRAAAQELPAHATA